MKIYRSSIDEFSELARAYLFDKKGFETATELYHKYEEAKKQESDAESELILFNKTLSEHSSPDALDERKTERYRLQDKVRELHRKALGSFNEFENFLETLPKAQYDRYRLRDNIRNYLEITQYPLGELEVESGISRGGLSRWEKNIMTSEPTLSFVLTAADRFGVSVSELLYGDPTKMSSEEKEIKEYVEMLIYLTQGKMINWKVVEPHFRRIHRQEAESNNYRLYKDTDGVRFRTDFNYEEPIKAYKESYYTILPESNDEVYLYSITPSEGLERPGIELYIKVADGHDEPVYSTYLGNEVINNSIEDLYNMAGQSSTVIEIGESARQSMSKLTEYVKKLKMKEGGKTSEK